MRKALATLFAILFVLTTILVLPLFNAERILLDAGTYKRALVENRAYQQLPALVAEQIETIKPFIAKPMDDKGMAFINNLSAKDWQTLSALLLPPDETRGMLENTLDQVFAYLNGETDTARLSLLALKAHLVGQAGQDLILQLLNTWPPCTMEQFAQFLAGQLAFCKPPQEVVALVTSQLQTGLPSMVAGIPDEVVIIKSAGAGALEDDAIGRLNILRMGIRFSPLLPLSLLFLVTLLGVRSFKGWLRWWGIPLFVSGLILAVLGFSILPTLDWAWANFILPLFPAALSAGITGLVHGLAGSVVGALVTPITLEAAIMGLLGLAAILGSFFVEANRKEFAPLATE